MVARQIRKYVLKRFLKFWSKEYNWNIRLNQNNLKLIFLVFIADYLSENKFTNNYIKLHRYYLENHERYKQLFLQIEDSWIKNNHFVTLQELPFDIQKYNKIIKIPYLMMNLSRYSCLIFPVYSFLKDKYKTSCIKEWYTSFYAFIIYYSLFYKLEGWKKHKTDYYDYKDILELRLYLSNIYSHNYQLIFKNNFNQLYILLNEVIPCKLLINLNYQNQSKN